LSTILKIFEYRLRYFILVDRVFTLKYKGNR